MNKNNPICKNWLCDCHSKELDNCGCYDDVIKKCKLRIRFNALYLDKRSRPALKEGQKKLYN